MHPRSLHGRRLSMPEEMDARTDTRVFLAIGAATIVIVGFLMWLIYGHASPSQVPGWAASLPAVNATLNASSALCLVFGFLAIRRGDRGRHRSFMLSALGLSGLFLVSYVVYHHFHGDTRFGGEGVVRPIYFFILITHVLLSIMAVPLVLTTVFFAATDRLRKHRRLARITLPIWLYVSVTGVLVFFFLRTWG